MASDIANIIYLHVEAGVPLLLRGLPGVGKTATIDYIAQAMGRHMETVIASTRDPTDFSGLPFIRDGSVHLSPPLYATTILEKAQQGIKSVLFLDEISTAPPAVQAALLRVIHEGWVGETRLPAETAILAAANEVAEAAGGWLLAPPMANRFGHQDFPLDVTGWVEGMSAGWGDPELVSLPADWKADYWPQSKSMVGAYIRAHAAALQQIPRDEVAAGKAWPSPRSWFMASLLHAAAEAAGAPHLQNPLMAGCVGASATTEYLTWLRALDLPNPEDLLKNPTAVQMPQQADRAYALLASVVTAATDRITTARWLACWEVLTCGLEQRHADIVAVSARGLLKHRLAIPNLPLPKNIQKFATLLGVAGLLNATAPASAGRRR